MRSSHFIKFASVLLTSFLVLQGAVAAPAITDKIGDVAVTIPVPPGFGDASTAKPLRELGQALTPPTGRMLAFLVTEGDLKRAASGKEAEMDRYFAAQTGRKYEGSTFTAADFDVVKATLRNQQNDVLEKAKPQVQKNVDNAMKELSPNKDDLATMKVGAVKSYGVHHEDARSISMAAVAKYSGVVNGEPFEYLMALVMTMVNVKGKILNLYAYRTYHSPADLEKVKAADRAWREAVAKAN